MAELAERGEETGTNGKRHLVDEDISCLGGISLKV